MKTPFGSFQTLALQFHFFLIIRFENPIDIMISHDWPGGIYNYGNVDQLLRYKKHFKDDIDSGRLGNPATMQVLQVDN